MKNLLLASLILFVILPTTGAFVPLPSSTTRTTSSCSKEDTSLFTHKTHARDAIAQELLSLMDNEDGMTPKHQKHRNNLPVKSRLHNPWKRIMELESAEDQAKALKAKIKTIRQEERLLQAVLVQSFLDASLLHAELDDLQHKEESPRYLMRKLVQAIHHSINHVVGNNVNRLLKALHLYHA